MHEKYNGMYDELTSMKIYDTFIVDDVPAINRGSEERFTEHDVLEHNGDCDDDLSPQRHYQRRPEFFRSQACRKHVSYDVPAGWELRQLAVQVHASK